MDETFFQELTDDQLKSEEPTQEPDEKGNSVLLEEMSNIKEDISYLRDLFVRRLSDDKQKNVLIQKVADGASYAFIEPFLHDIILLLDRLEKADDDFSVSVREELYDIIHRRGVDIIQTSSDFDPSIHKAVKVVEDQNSEALHIVNVSRNGYTFSGKVLRPAEVVVARPNK